MSAIATVLARMGHTVSGSDLRESRALERLGLLDITTHVGHDAANLPDALDAVVISTAIPVSNPEVRAAVERSIPVLRRADALRAIVATRTTIAVSGSHGKTTTSSMLALILRAAGWHPSFLIGGDLNEVGTNAVFDTGEWLVVEADESDGTFLELAPHDAVVTSVLPDHLDHYGDFPALIEAFERFVGRVPGVCALCADDEVAAAIAARAPGRVVSYGFADTADYRMEAYGGGGVAPGPRSPAAPSRSARWSSRCPAATTRSTRPAPRPSRPSSGCRSRRSRAPSVASVAWRGASSSAASATASPTSTTTRTFRATSTR